MLIHIIVNAKSTTEESLLLTTLTTADCAKKLVAAALPPVGDDELPSRSIISPVYVLVSYSNDPSSKEREVIYFIGQ